MVGELHQQKFSLQANRKTREGDGHPDHDAQFVYVNDNVRPHCGGRASDLGR